MHCCRQTILFFTRKMSKCLGRLLPFILLLLHSVVLGHPGLCPFSFSLFHLPYFPKDAIHYDALSAASMLVTLS